MTTENSAYKNAEQKYDKLQQQRRLEEDTAKNAFDKAVKTLLLDKKYIEDT